MEFHLWYLKEKGWIRSTDNGMLAITVEGVDRVNSELKPKITNKLLTDQSRSANRTSEERRSDDRRSDDRRAGKDRRSGVDTRSAEEKAAMGERRSSVDRRSGPDRRLQSRAAQETIGRK